MYIYKLSFVIAIKHFSAISNSQCYIRLFDNILSWCHGIKHSNITSLPFRVFRTIGCKICRNIFTVIN